MAKLVFKKIKLGWFHTDTPRKINYRPSLMEFGDYLSCQNERFILDISARISNLKKVNKLEKDIID